MEKRYQAFLSSAFKELSEERRAVVTALLELNCHPVGMDLFDMLDDEDGSLVRRLIDDCDYYLVVLGANFRMLDTAEIDSIEREHDHALAKAKPVLAFLRPDDKMQPEADGGYAELSGRLQALRDRLESGACRYWNTPTELGGAVSRACVQLIQSRPAEGWVRAGRAKTPEDYENVARLADQVRVLEKEVADLRAAELRVAPDLAQGDETVELEYSLRGEQMVFRIGATWTEVFAAAAIKAIELPTSKEIETELSAWIGEHANSFDVVLAESSLQKIKLQFFTLGLMETRWLPQGRVWALTDRGRVLLGELRGQKAGATA